MERVGAPADRAAHARRQLPAPALRAVSEFFREHREVSFTGAATGRFERTSGGRLATPRVLEVAFVRPDTRSAPAVVEHDIPSSARPAAPVVRQVVPIFRWEDPAPGRSVRRGAVTTWGNDPAQHSTSVADDVLHSSFPPATCFSTGMTVPEHPTTELKVAAHDVAYDGSRRLWCCDIHITRQDDTALEGYFPFVRLALARFQPRSVLGCHLSAAVTADFAQLAPDRSVVVTGAGSTRSVQVTGPGATIGPGSGPRNEVRLTVERQLDGVTDPVLRWQPAGVGFTATLTDPTSATGVLTWSGAVALPTGAGPLRLVVEEFEAHRDGGGGTVATRLVHTDTVPLS
ncbi:hypothetical protein [Saccharothrix xinjiangensis]|uniref:Uncharacterized protein n=1 Tax=Saccharothrix xinjiangensis TaxID=204798 RepID=A0ABV9YJ00_9PSEU